MSRKPTIAVLFGGRSAEHDVSIMSARNVIAAIDAEKYDVIAIGVARDGRWLLSANAAHGIGDREAGRCEVALSPGGNGQLVGTAGHALPRVDVLFPVLHGPFGEDGTVQGLAETAGVPYVGSGVLASALCMDKDLTKRLLVAADIPVARSITMRRGDTTTFEAVERRLGAPVFVKPARQGSSFGVGKAANPEAFRRAVEIAFQYDDKLLVEAFVAAREIECAVLERADGTLIVSEPGEIITQGSHAFYTYDAKYVDADGAVVRTPADVPARVTHACRKMAETVFRQLECAGMARVDFFLAADGSLLVNEVNTIPGFTDMSMYAKALAASGISYARAVDMLIDHAVARHRDAVRLQAAA